MNVYIRTTIAVFLAAATLAGAQETDTLKTQELKGITIHSYRFPVQEFKPLDNVHQTFITSGKKQGTILLQDLPVNLAEKTGRQLFATVPGVFVYDMDGSGNQVNISTRGLDPHRSWEYNVRQNGVITNSDMYGYPASHYNPPMEAIQKIELLHGTASLQYGSQFGGMINYVTKQPDTTRALGFESINSAGSFGLLSSYNAIGGRLGKLTYYAYYQRRVSDGYRENADSDAQAQFLSLHYAFSSKISAKAELGRSQYLYHMPGPLTDAQFAEDPRQSTRSRNYYSPDIYVPSLTLDWQLSPKTKLNWINSAVIGSRSSVQLIGFADAPDTIQAATLQYKARQVDIDHFNSYTSALRLQQDYKLGRFENTLVAGVRYINNDLHRRQQGKGTTGVDYDLSLTTPEFGRNMHYKTQNVALFAENLFRVTPKLHFSAGLRVENGTTKMTGIIAYLPDEEIPQDIGHRYALLGATGQYHLDKANTIYVGWSQAYRPVIMSDVIPPTALDRIDPGLEDAFGHVLEGGVRGKLRNRLNYDLSFFQILYKNRIGDLVLNDPDGSTYIFKTNIGDSRTNGIELYANYMIAENRVSRFSVFSATSFFDGIYRKGQIRNGDQNTDIANNRVETIPRWISRNGFQASFRQLTALLQYSYVADSFSDALNTVAPSSNGARGLVPAYSLWDLNLSYRFSSRYILRCSLNNLTDKQYFTKRPGGYPGPGVWSSDGRNVLVSFGIRL